MSVTPREPDGSSARHYTYDTAEFSRVTNLSDGVFAIALTLLVLTLDVPDVPAEELAAALVGEAQQLVVFALSFLLVANIWWIHHKLAAQLAFVEPVIMALNLGLLGMVALVPFPTSLVGTNPGSRVAVIFFMTLFLAITLVYVTMLVRIRTVAAWRDAPPPGLFPWLLAGWVGQMAGMVIALVVAIFAPVAALVILAASGTISGVILSFVAPRSYRRWAWV